MQTAYESGYEHGPTAIRDQKPDRETLWRWLNSSDSPDEGMLNACTERERCEVLGIAAFYSDGVITDAAEKALAAYNRGWYDAVREELEG